MKYRGKMRVSFELLKDLLQLEEDIDITNIIRTEEDHDYETFTVFLSSNDKASFTYNTAECAKIPLSDYRGKDV